MKNSRKPLAALVAFAAFACAVHAQPAVKLMVVDMAKLYDNHYKTVEQNAKITEAQLSQTMATAEHIQNGLSIFTIVILIGTVVSGAFGYAFSGRLSAHRPGWEVISWQVAAFLPLSLITTAFLWPPTLLDAPRSAWIALAYVSFISQLVAFFVFNAAMSLGGVARSGQLMLLQPFVIVTLSVPVNGERFDVSTLAYAAAVVAVVVIGQRMMVKRR